MKRILSGIIVCGVLLFIALPTYATVWTYQPTPADMYDLDHRWYYSWGINTNDFKDEVISEVTLTFTNIQDYIVEPNDILYMHLFDNAPLGVSQFTDDDAPGDAFVGQGMFLGTWSDPLGGGPNDPWPEISFNFSDWGAVDQFAAWAADGNIGLGFDPDCHYYNDGVKLSVVTTAPEPGTLSLLGLGLVIVGGRFYRRKKTA